MYIAKFWPPLRAGLRQAIVSFSALVSPRASALPRICVVVEGKNDIEFFRRVSTMLHAADHRLPDLAAMEQRRELVFIPCGGGDSLAWAWRLAGMAPAEFHLLDRDVSPATETRRQIADVVNCRPQCHAVLTHMRSLENYLHPAAVFEVSGLRVEYSADDNVADLVARHAYERYEGHQPWESLPSRARKRRRGKAKAWLNTRAVERMTPQRLAERDPNDEVRAWLETIARLARGSR